MPSRERSWAKRVLFLLPGNRSPLMPKSIRAADSPLRAALPDCGPTPLAMPQEGSRAFWLDRARPRHRWGECTGFGRRARGPLSRGDPAHAASRHSERAPAGDHSRRRHRGAGPPPTTKRQPGSGRCRRPLRHPLGSGLPAVPGWRAFREPTSRGSSTTGRSTATPSDCSTRR